MASDLSVDAPAFSPSGGGSSSSCSGVDNLALATEADDNGGSARREAVPQAPHFSGGGGGSGLPAYMVNCYPFVQQPLAGAAPSADGTGGDGSPGSTGEDSALPEHLLQAASPKGAAPPWSSGHHGPSAAAAAHRPAYSYPSPFIPSPAATAAVMVPLYGGWPPGPGYHYPPPPAMGMPDSFIGYSELTGGGALHNGATASGGSRRGGAGGGRRGRGALGRPPAAGAAVKGSVYDRQHRHNGDGRVFEDEQRAEERDSGDRRGGGGGTRGGGAGKPKSGAVSIGTQNDPPWLSVGRAGVAAAGSAKPDGARRRTQIVKDACLQTEFSEAIADLTLADEPSPLYADGRSSLSLNYASAVRWGSGTRDNGADGQRNGTAWQRSTEAAVIATATRDAPRSARDATAGGGAHGVKSASCHAAATTWPRNVDREQLATRGAAAVVAGLSTHVGRVADDGGGPATAAGAEARLGPDGAGHRASGGGGAAAVAAAPLRGRTAVAAGAAAAAAAADHRTTVAPPPWRSAGDGRNGGLSDDPASAGEPIRRRRCRRGPRKGRAGGTVAAATDSTGPASSTGDGGHSSGDDDLIDDDDEAQRNRSGGQQRRLDGSTAAATAADQAASALNGDFPVLVGSGAVAAIADRPSSTWSAASSTAAAAAAAHSYSQAVKSAQQQRAAGGAPARHPAAGAPLSAWAQRTQQPSEEDGDDTEGCEGFMFSSVAYANRSSALGSGERRAGSGGHRGVGGTLGGTSAATAALMSLSGSRRQKKVETALLAATEEHMEISLEQRVLLSQIGRMSAPAAAAAAHAKPPAPAAPPAASGKKSQQRLALNLSDMIAAAEVRKKKEPPVQQQQQLHDGLHGKTSDGAAAAAAAKGLQRGGGRRGAASGALNALDSTAPTVKRGKERENPKPKRPSALKKVILKEREDKKQSRVTCATGATASLAAAAAASSDDQLNRESSELLGNEDVAGTVPTSSSGCSIQHGAGGDEESPLEAAAVDRQHSLDASFEGGAGALSTPGCASGQLSSRSGDAFTPLSQASLPLSPISQTSPMSVDALSPEISPFASEAGTPVRPPPLDVAKEIQLQQEIAHKIHSRRFREYCDQLLDRDIDDCCSTLLQELVRFQERLFARDPIKAKARRRLVLGLREVTKHLRLRKIKLVVVSPNLERIQSKGGLDEALSTIVALCREQAVPLVFALGRRALGRACGKLVPVSVVGVFMYDGAETYFKLLMDLTQKARYAYEEMVKLVAQEAADERQRIASAAAAAARHGSPPHPAAAATVVPLAAGDGSETTVRRAQNPLLPPSEVGLDHSRLGPKPAPALPSQQHRRPPTAGSGGLQVFVNGRAATGRSDDDGDEESARLRELAGDGDAGNEADVEDSLQDSAVPDGYRLLTGAAAAGEITVQPQPLVRKSSGVSGCSRDRSSSGAASLARSAAAESEGSTLGGAGSATVTCESGGGDDSCDSEASTAGLNESGNGGGGSRKKSGRAFGDVSGDASLAAAPTTQLLRGSRERVESWVAAHSSVGGCGMNSTSGVAGGDHLGVDDVAEFAATLSACTANSEALLLGSSAAAE